MRVLGAILICGGLAAWAVTPSVHGSAPPPGARTAADWRKPQESGGTLSLERGWQGHFFVNGDIAGAPVRFLVDTGASTVALAREDARAAGVDMNRLTFSDKVATASGVVEVAHVTLPSLRVGDIQLLDVPADVIAVDKGLPLLGQSFLARIDKVAIEGDRMTLTKL